MSRFSDQYYGYNIWEVLDAFFVASSVKGKIVPKLSWPQH
jgi:hypothetical protein